MDFFSYLQTARVESVGFRPPESVGSDATVAEVIDIMQSRRVGCILVVSSERVLEGIFTERDLMRKVLSHQGDAEFGDPIAKVMTKDPVTVREDETLAVLFRRMYEGGFRHMPLLDSAGRLLGTVSIKRVVSFLADQFPETVYNLPPEPEKFGAPREGA